MPLPHDLPSKPAVRAWVFSTSPHHWYWGYAGREPWTDDTLRHGPFGCQADAFASALHMVELL